MGATVLPTGLADAMLGQIPSSLYVQAHVGDPGAAGTDNVAPGTQVRGLATLLSASGGQRAWSGAVEVSGITPGSVVSAVTLWSATVGGVFRLAVDLDAPTACPGIIRVTLGPVTLAGEAGGLPQGAVAVLGAGAIAAAGVRVAYGVAAVDGAGVIAAAGGLPMPQGAAAVEGSGTIAAAGARVGYGAALVGGVGTIAAAGQQIAGDSTAPTITAFTLGTPSGLTVPVTLTATDAVGVVEWVVNTTAGNPTPGAPNSAPASWTAGGAGTYTLYAHVRDAANNWATMSAGPVTVSAAGVSFVGAGALAVGNGVSSVSAAMPAGVADGDIILVATDNTDGTTPAGFTPLGAGTTGILSVWWKRASGAQGSVTVGAVADDGEGGAYPASARAYVFRGLLASGSPVDVLAGRIAVSTTTASGSALTTTAAGDVLIMFLAEASNDTATAITSVGGPTDQFVAGGSNGSGGGIYMGYTLDAGAAGAKAAPTMTFNGVVGAGVLTLSLKKAP